MRTLICFATKLALLGESLLSGSARAQTRVQPEGTVVSWGYKVIPYVEPGSRFTAIAARYGYTLALQTDGSVVAWGERLGGGGDNVDFDVMTVPLAARSGVVSIAAGGDYAMALKSDGSVVAWGANYDGQTTVPIIAQSGVKAIAVGWWWHSVALKTDGSVVAWGHNEFGQTTVPLEAQSGVAAIAAGYDHTVALKTDGSVVAWGHNEFGQATVPLAAQSGVVAIAAGYYHTVALKADGSVVAWGYNLHGQATVPLAAQSEVVAISAGHFHTVALKTDGSVVTWGIENEFDQTTVPLAAQSGVVAIAAGYYHTVALKTDGSAVAWGSGEFGVPRRLPLGTQSGVVAISTGNDHTVALKSDGSVVAWGRNEFGQTTVPLAAQSGVAAIAAGSDHTVALKTDGSVVAWGANSSGQTAVPLTAQSGVVAIAAGHMYTVALMTDGSVVAWGANSSGQTAVPPAAQSGVVAIAAGYAHTVALKADGSVVAWGANSAGQTAVPLADQSGMVAIAAGYAHTVGLKADGSVVAWGSSELGQTTVPITAQSGVAAIAAGSDHTVALKTDGSVVAWGSNDLGQTTVPIWARSNVIAISAGWKNSVALVAKPTTGRIGISEVQAAARTSRVAVHYRLSFSGATSVSVSLLVSTNGGATFAPVPGGGAVSGDVGAAVAPGERTMFWNPDLTFSPNTFLPNCKVRITATAGGVTTSAMSSAFAVETPGPDTLVTVQGRVMDPQTGLPLPGATVNLGGRSAVTSSAGDYVLTGVPFASGSALTITKPGQTMHTATLAAAPGTRQVVLPDVRLPAATASGIPVVTGIEPKLNGLFLAGVPLVNEYTASVNWNGSTPGEVRFFANENLVARKTGTGSEYTANVDIPASFPPALRLGANRLRVVATSETGLSSPAAEFEVHVLPLPFGLERATALYPFTLYGESHLSVDFHLPPGDPIPTVFDLPFVGKFGAEAVLSVSVDYEIFSGEWELEMNSGSEFGVTRERARPLFPGLTRKPSMKLYLGDEEAEFKIFSKAQGRASPTTGWVWGDVAAGISLDTKFELTRYGVADLFTPGFSAVLRKVPGLEQTLKNTSVIIWAKPKFEGSAVFTPMPEFRLPPEWDFKRLEAVGKIGLEAAYEPQFTKNMKVKIYLGGEPTMTFQYPGELLKEARFRIYSGAEAEVYFFTLGPAERELVAWSYPASQILAGLAQQAVSSLEHSDAISLVSRNYLADGGERFVAEGEARAKQARGATTALEDFRMLGRKPQGQLQRQGIGGASERLAQADLPLLENVYPGSAPALAGRGADLMLLYVADNGGASGLQFTDIRWTRFDGTNWTQPVAILADTRAEFAPQVVFDGNGDAIAVWERVADPDFNTMDLGAFAAQLEIVTARWDHDAKGWSEPELLTTNRYLDQEPLLCGPMANGDALLVWTQNTANQLMGTNTVGTAGNSDVLWRQWTAAGRSWSAPQPLVTNLAYRLSHSFAGSGKRAVYAWTRDLDGSLTNAADQQVFFRGWSNGVWGGVTQFTADTLGNQNVRAAVSPAGDAYLLWRAGTNLVFNRNFAATNQVARSDSQTAGFTDYALTLGPAGNLALVWQEMSGNGPDAHYRIYDPASDSWSRDALLFTDAGLERSFAPVWDDVGNLTLAYDKVDILKTNKTLTFAGGGSVTISNVPQPGRVDLGVLKRALVKDVALPPGSLRVQAENYLPGAALNLEADVRNTGDVAVKDVVVAFYVGDPASGGVLIENVTLTGWLEAGRTATAAAVWVLPDTGEARPLFAVADPAGLITELSDVNNTQSLTVGGTDLAVTLLSAAVEANGAARIIAQVENVGAPSAAASTVALRRVGETNAPLATTAVFALEPGRLAQVALDVPPGGLPEGLTALWLRADDAAVTGDENPSNNIVTFAVNRFVDSDGDELPDGWELANNLNPHDASDAGLDSDADGESNSVEYLAGTDPRDPSSYLRMEVVTEAGANGIQVAWGSVADRLYSLQRVSNMGLKFTNIAEHILSTPPENTYSDTSSTNAATYFYRVLVE